MLNISLGGWSKTSRVCIRFLRPAEAARAGIVDRQPYLAGIRRGGAIHPGITSARRTAETENAQEEDWYCSKYIIQWKYYF